jgi:2-phosphosulfolactate phosphatase
MVVVIDVLRAFSTAAYALAAGASDILLADTVAAALALRERFPGSLVMGEVGGLPVPGFDFGNSPTGLPSGDFSPGGGRGAPLAGCRLIQRTSAGTQGVLLSRSAGTLLAASFVVAAATVGFIRRAAPQQVTFVLTGLRPGGRGEEDAACADYLEACLRGPARGLALAPAPDPAPYLARARNSTVGQIFADPAQPDFPAGDLEACLAVDRFDFAMVVQRAQGLFILEKHTLLNLSAER